MTTLYIGFAGVLGALTRYAFTVLWKSASQGVFPWGTLFCNLIGCLLLSFIAFSVIPSLPVQLRLAMTTGFLGAFTTFSTLSYEAFALMDSGHAGLAFAYMLTSLWGGLLFAWLGNRMALKRSTGRRIQ